MARTLDWEASRDWRLARADDLGLDASDDGPSAPDFDDSAWENVHLPQPARLEEEDPNRPWQGISWWRKRFVAPTEWSGLRTCLRFEAAMHHATVWLNGEPVAEHEGGYLPFLVRLDGRLRLGAENTVVVRLDSRDDPEIPPGHASNETFDFAYFHGLYREAAWQVAPLMRITDPLEEELPASGGVFVWCESVARERAEVRARTHLRNDSPEPIRFRLRTALLDPDGGRVGFADDGTTLPPGADAYIEQGFRVRQPRLWSLDDPALHTLVSRVETEEGAPLDEVRTRLGIRSLEFDHASGFRLNDEPIQLRGANRHQVYPLVGNAASALAQRRDAVRLREAGFQLVRMGHYPAHPALMEACDELGLLVIVPTPGWQHYSPSERFRRNVHRNIREMIRRDRNHPSVALWEVSLNETYAPEDDFCRECDAVAREEFGEAPMLTAGDGYGRRDHTRPIYDVHWTGWDDEAFMRPSLYPARRGLHREYGDYEFGGPASSSRAGFADGEAALLRQAWNYQWSHNRNRATDAFGDAMWCYNDYWAPCYAPGQMFRGGAVDVWRRRKPVWWFYASQRDPRSPRGGPVVRIAHGWSERPSPTKVIVYSNCDEVELWLAGELLACRRPDGGPTTGYAIPRSADPHYWARSAEQIELLAGDACHEVVGGPGEPWEAEPFGGGNCRELAHAPFTFSEIAWIAGELRAVGRLEGRAVAEHAVRTPGPAEALAIEVDDAGIALERDGCDTVFVHVAVVDASGETVCAPARPVSLACTGPARVLGTATRLTEGGVASFLLLSERAEGAITLHASGVGLRAACGELPESPG